MIKLIQIVEAECPKLYIAKRRVAHDKYVTHHYINLWKNSDLVSVAKDLPMRIQIIISNNDPQTQSYLNSRISNTLDQVISYRIGTEILQNRISYRAGYRFEESPRGITNQNLEGFSLGLGYKINNSRIDLSFEKFSLSDTHQMLDAGFLGNINLDKEKSTVKLSIVTVL
jgi:hypothetical protein